MQSCRWSRYWRPQGQKRDVVPLPLSPDVEQADGWDKHVQIPVAMLIKTMQQLSAWGPAMGMTVIGCWACALCTVPSVVATESSFLLFCTVVLFLVPFIVALAPANVSTSCDDLLDQINDLGLVGGREHKHRVHALYRSMKNLSRGQGLGFKVMGTVVDKRLLVRIVSQSAITM